MSRAKAKEVSSPLSLFPFIGVLLSTMGALLVVLIAVSRSARDSALREVAVQSEQLEQRRSIEISEEDRRKLEEVARFSAKIKEIGAEAEKRLRDDQLRLSHVEEQMRLLEDQ